MDAPPPYPGAPRWVRVAGAILILLALLLVVVMLIRGPDGRGHGPGLHRAPSSGVASPDTAR